MRQIWLGSSIALFIAGCSSVAPVSFFSSLPDGVTLIEEVSPQAGKVVIPYSKYRLDNGLTVILSPDDSDPLVHLDVTYHVGSAREDVGKSGFAHFFEHMMFQGSEHVGDQEHFRIITEAGGSLNGTTNRDRTNYYETVPANQLEKMLWLESDRMGFLLDAVSQRKFEIQRDTVKNERAQNYDNRPYGLMWERIGEAMYPEGHPYSWQTIGYVEDLDRVDVNDLKAFFLRWYGPNNATITIGGDIDTKQTLAWVNQYFGAIPVGPEVKSAPKAPAKLAEPRYITLQDRVQQPMLVMSWPTAYLGAEEQASLDVLSSVLAGGKNSMLYKQFVETGKAVSAGAFQDCAELACTFNVYLMGKANTSLAPLYQQLSEQLSQFGLADISQDQLDALLGRAEASAVFGLESVRGKVTQLAENELYFGEPNRIETELSQLRAVTVQSIDTSYQKYIKSQPSVTLSVVPKGKPELAARSANFTTPARQLPDYQPIRDEQLTYRPTPKDFDRSVMPSVSGSVKGVMPELYRLHLDNGIEVLGTVSDETPIVQLQIELPAGKRYVARGKEGLAGLTAAMMQEGTTERDYAEIETELDKLGSHISFNDNGYTSTIYVSSLEKNLSTTLSVLEEMLFKPAFAAKDFERLKQQTLQGLVYEHQKPAWLASQATRKALYGNTIFSRSSDGTKASLEGVTLEDVKAFYRSHYTPQGAQIVVVGDISQRNLRDELAFLEQWQGPSAPLFTPQIIPKLTQSAIYLVDKPNSPQSIVRMARQGLPFDATGELYLAQLANFNLAGNFNSRINQNLREDKGYTYGANGYIYGLRETGAMIFDAQVRADATLVAIQEFINEMNEFSVDGVSEKELQFMRLAIGQRDALRYETPSKKAQLLSGILTYSLDDDYLEQREQILQQVDKATIDQVAAKWFDPNEYQIIVVGDAKKLEPELKKLGLPLKRVEIEP